MWKDLPGGPGGAALFLPITRLIGVFPVSYIARILELVVRGNKAIEEQVQPRLSCHQMVHVFAEVRNSRQVVVRKKGRKACPGAAKEDAGRRIHEKENSRKLHDPLT